MRLFPNNTELIKVSSRKSWNETDLEVHPDEEYEFMAIGHWNDMLVESGANGYSKTYMKPFDNLKRSPLNNWFALMGSINKQFDFLIGGYKKLVFDTSGKLSFYANDVPGLYWNNSHSITLFVTRLR
jgi:hypothetical protein